VRANLALWPIVFSVTSSDLATLQRRSTRGRQDPDVPRRDFSPEEVAIAAPRITDRERRHGLPGPALDRYAAETVVTVRSAKIDAVRALMSRSGELVARRGADPELRVQHPVPLHGLEKTKPR